MYYKYLIKPVIKDTIQIEKANNNTMGSIVFPYIENRNRGVWDLYTKVRNEAATTNATSSSSLFLKNNSREFDNLIPNLNFYIVFHDREIETQRWYGTFRRSWQAKVTYNYQSTIITSENGLGYTMERKLNERLWNGDFTIEFIGDVKTKVSLVIAEELPSIYK